MALSAIALILMIGITRAAAYGPERATESRYLYLIAALILPCLAVAADAIATRWRQATPVVVCLLLVGTPGNIAAADDRQPELLGPRRLVLAMAGSPALAAVDADQAFLDPFLSPLNVDFLQRGVDSGRIVPNPDPWRIDEAIATRLLLFLQSATSVDGMACEAIEPGEAARLGPGDVIANARANARVEVGFPGGSQAMTIPAEGSTLTVRTVPISVTLQDGSNLDVCRP
ncbi:MAG: hypothetical protein Q8K72_18625, partial [Acidimicrobiales bacterium]|nr:hypothetical protein [Acidimicrobiales bacterium]